MKNEKLMIVATCGNEYHTASGMSEGVLDLWVDDLLDLFSSPFNGDNDIEITIKKIDSDEEKERKILELANFMGNAMETLDSIISDTFKNRNKK